MNSFQDLSIEEAEQARVDLPDDERRRLKSALRAASEQIAKQTTLIEALHRSNN
jgi:hypothetical protein